MPKNRLIIGVLLCIMAELKQKKIQRIIIFIFLDY